MSEHVELREPYAEPRQQHAAGMMGIYIFLATEIMLFGGLLAVAYEIRILHGADYIVASKQLHVWIGAINTVLLLTSSLTVALAVHAARQGSIRAVLTCLGLAVLLGIAFLGIKAFEYSVEYREGLLPIGDAGHFAGVVQHQFMDLYLIATGLHALHLLIGIGVLAGVGLQVARRWVPLPDRAVVVEVAGVYWHFVDVIWIFLYPALYLAR
jgi:cytochrome c oxidase subunit 3